MKKIENYLKIPVAEGDITDTIDIEKDNGIFAFYCNEEKIIHTYLFDKDKWNNKSAKEWIENKEEPDMSKIKKRLDFKLKEFNDEKLSFDAIASTSDIDRDGDTLQASGWVLKNFRKNPVLLWGHNSSMLPVGRAENVKIDGEALTFTAVFTPADINPLGEQLYRMFKAKFLNAFSVRFDPIKWERRVAEEENKNDMRRVGYNYIKQELLEISPVAVPSLPTALANRDYQNMMMKGFLISHSDLIEDKKEREEFLKSLPKVCVKCKKDPDKPHAITVTNFPRLVKCKNEGGYLIYGNQISIKDKTEEELIKEIGDIVAEHDGIEKSGRVLSAKNRSLIKSTVESMTKSSGALTQLYDATEPDEDDSDKDIERLRTDLEKINLENGDKDLIQRGKALLEEV